MIAVVGMIVVIAVVGMIVVIAVVGMIVVIAVVGDVGWQLVGNQRFGVRTCRQHDQGHQQEQRNHSNSDMTCAEHASLGSHT